MAKLTRDDVLRLAALARISLSDEEVDSFAVEMSDILQYVEQLSSVDVSGLQPTNQVTGLTNVYREDVVKHYGYEPQTLLENVPSTDNSQIKVKKMIT